MGEKRLEEYTMDDLKKDRLITFTDPEGFQVTMPETLFKLRGKQVLEEKEKAFKMKSKEE